MDAAIRAAINRMPAAMLIAGLVTAAAPSVLPGQNLTGTVVEAATGRPLDGARIFLLDEEDERRGQTLSREDGRFAILVPRSGSWRIGVELIGFSPVRSDPLEIRTGDWLVLEITLAVEAIPLEPVVVTARRAAGSPDIQRFYDRRDRAARSGVGYFIAREEIDRMSPHRPTDILRTAPGVRVVRGRGAQGSGLRMSGGCVPAIYIDGMRINRVNIHDSLDDFVSVLDIEGLEVYRGASSQVAQYHDPRGCGLVLVWTRAGFHDPESTFRWRTVFGVAAMLALIMVLLN
jgi:hypothetical protein